MGLIIISLSRSGMLSSFSSLFTLSTGLFRAVSHRAISISESKGTKNPTLWVLLKSVITIWKVKISVVFDTFLCAPVFQPKSPHSITTLHFSRWLLHVDTFAEDCVLRTMNKTRRVLCYPMQNCGDTFSYRRPKHLDRVNFAKPGHLLWLGSTLPHGSTNSSTNNYNAQSVFTFNVVWCLLINVYDIYIYIVTCMYTNPVEWKCLQKRWANIDILSPTKSTCIGVCGIILLHSATYICIYSECVVVCMRAQTSRTRQSCKPLQKMRKVFPNIRPPTCCSQSLTNDYYSVRNVHTVQAPILLVQHI